MTTSHDQLVDRVHALEQRVKSLEDLMVAVTSHAIEMSDKLYGKEQREAVFKIMEKVNGSYTHNS